MRPTTPCKYGKGFSHIFVTHTIISRIQQELVQGGWIGCLVTPLGFEMSTETIKKMLSPTSKHFDVCMGVQLESVITIYSFCALWWEGGASPSHTLPLTMAPVNPAPKFLDQPLILDVSIFYMALCVYHA